MPSSDPSVVDRPLQGRTGMMCLMGIPDVVVEGTLYGLNSSLGAEDGQWHGGQWCGRQAGWT